MIFPAWNVPVYKNKDRFKIISVSLTIMYKIPWPGGEIKVSLLKSSRCSGSDLAWLGWGCDYFRDKCEDELG